MNLPRSPRFAGWFCACVLAAWSAPGGSGQIRLSIGDGRAETLKPVAALPVEIAGAFEEAAGFEQAKSGEYFVFDRRAQAVYGIDAAATAAWKVVRIGTEPGHVYQPRAFAVEPGGNFAVVDAPSIRERVQIFTAGGAPLGGFILPDRRGARMNTGGMISNGVSSLQFTGATLLINIPEDGALITEYTLAGATARTFGTLRATGHEGEPDLHLALNAGIPVVNPRGGYYFVFLAGTPIFRKYDAAGRLVFERHIEGRELDEPVMALPQKWIRKGTPGEEGPLVYPLVRAAAADPAGNLWVALTVPYTYVYNPDGDKTRVVQFSGAGLLTPACLFFAPSGRLLVAPGCYEFAPDRRAPR
jgi:hypothetical protein